MRYRIKHITRYSYTEPVPLSHNAAHLRPLDDDRQTVESFRLAVSPLPRVSTVHVDVNGNQMQVFQIQEGHKEFEVSAESVVEVRASLVPDPARTSPWDLFAGSIGHLPRGTLATVAEFRHPSPHAPLLQEAKDIALKHFAPGRPLLEAGFDLICAIHRDFKYSPQSTSIATPVLEIIRIRRGVCQDFAHLALSCLRSLGLPARYVSGYLETVPPPGRPRLVGADASHAWIQIWVPDWGWVDLDPTNACIPSERHVRVAVGRDFADVTPLKGLLLGGGTQTVRVSVDVEPLTAAPVVQAQAQG